MRRNRWPAWLGMDGRHDRNTQFAARTEQWAADGCTGPRPSPDRKARAKLEQVVHESEADAAATTAAGNRLGQETLALQTELHAAQERERAARLDVMTEDGMSVVAKLRKVAHEAATLAFQTVALRNLLMLQAGNSEVDRRASVRFLDELSGTGQDNAEALVPIGWVLTTNHSSEQMASFRTTQNEWRDLLDRLGGDAAATVAPAKPDDSHDVVTERAA